MTHKIYTRSISISIVLFVCSLFVQAKTTIEIEISDYNGKSELSYMYPVDGKLCTKAYKKLKPKRNGKYKFTFNDKVGGFYKIWLDRKQVRFYLPPDSKTKLKFSQGNLNETLRFEGDMRELNSFLHQLDRKFVGYLYSTGPHPSKPDFENIDAIEYFDSVEYEHQKEMMRIDSFFSAFPHDNRIENIIRDDCLYYYANFQLCSIINKSPPATLWGDPEQQTPEEKKQLKYFLESWEPILTNSLENIPLNNNRVLSSENYVFFLNAYIHYYRFALLNETNSEKGRWRMDYTYDTYERFVSIPGLAEEYLHAEAYELWAFLWFDFWLTSGTMYHCQDALRFYKNLKSKIPQSGLFDYYDKNYDRIVKYVKSSASAKGQEFQLIPDYEQISEFEEIIRPFRGKVIFVDMWATWCGPCIEEFQYNDKLYDFAEKHPIEILYLSRDNPKHKQRWIKGINTYRLKGHHMIVKDELAWKIWNEISDEGVQGIPRYLIIDKEGNIANKNAPRLSDWERLKNSLEDALSN